MFAETIRVCLDKILKPSRLTDYLEGFKTTLLLVTLFGTAKFRMTVLPMLFLEGCFKVNFSCHGQVRKGVRGQPFLAIEFTSQICFFEITWKGTILPGDADLCGQNPCLRSVTDNCPRDGGFIFDAKCDGKEVFINKLRYSSAVVTQISSFSNEIPNDSLSKIHCPSV